VRLPRERDRIADLWASAGLSLILVILVLVTPDGPATTAGRIAALGCALVQGATVAVLRLRPEAAMAVAVAAGVGLELLTPDIGWLGQVAAVLACYTRVRTPRRSLWVLALLVAATPWKIAAGGDWSNLLLAAAGPALGWTLGELGRTRELRRADQRRRIVQGERERIARELHDVLAHTVSVIVVQAAAAEDVFDRSPEQARKALGTIGTAARSTLAELRVLLQTMSADDPGEAGPQPGLAQLGALVTALGATGLRVELRTDLRELPAAVDLSAYRIVQESLTNTLRHSRATRAEVTVRCGPGALLLEVCDDGPARATGRVEGSAHRGIVGMRERAHLLGGTLQAGPLPGGGFRVRADLPLEQAA
jgi:signal transduction histidine kinase